MLTTHQDIQSFAVFAEQQLSSGDSELSIDDLFDMWRSANPPADELAQSLTAVRADITDMSDLPKIVLARRTSSQLSHKLNCGQERR